jgi:ABC transporter
VINRPSRIDASKPDGLRPSGQVAGEVVLEQVTFSYPSRPGVQVFRGFCLHARAGETTALVGESGSGKSTVISLVERFYDVQVRVHTCTLLMHAPESAQSSLWGARAPPRFARPPASHACALPSASWHSSHPRAHACMP